MNNYERISIKYKKGRHRPFRCHGLIAAGTAFEDTDDLAVHGSISAVVIYIQKNRFELCNTKIQI